MGFHAYSSPYDWSRIAPYKTKAAQVPGGIVDLSVGSPVDPVPQSVREALAAASDGDETFALLDRIHAVVHQYYLSLIHI